MTDEAMSPFRRRMIEDMTIEDMDPGILDSHVGTAG